MLKKNSLIVLLIIVFIGVTIATGIWIEKKLTKPLKEPVVPPSAESKQVTLEITPSEPSEIDISDWKTYRNEEYGFVIKYPESWKSSCGFSGLEKCSHEFLHSSNYKTGLAGEVKRGLYIISGARINFSVTKVDYRMNWLEWAQRARGMPGELISSQQIDLNNNPTWKMVFVNESLQPPRKYISIAFPNPSQEKVYEFILSIVAGENEEEYINTFNQILLTFEFIN